MSVLAVVVAITAFGTAVNALLLSAVIRLLRADRRSSMPSLPELGARVGAFEVTTLDGATVDDTTLSEGTSLVAVLSATCAPCARLVPQLDERAAELPTRTIALVVDPVGSPETRAFADQLRPGLAVALVAPDSPVIHALDAGGGTPTLVRVVDGVVDAAGHDLDSVLAAAPALSAAER